jgi:hypothetical protein
VPALWRSKGRSGAEAGYASAVPFASRASLD